MITVVKQPQLFTTLNLALFQVTSNRPTILQFRVTLLDALSGFAIAVQKYAVIPQVNNGTSFNLAPLLGSFVQPSVNASANIVETIAKNHKKYSLTIEELYIDGVTGNVITGDTLAVNDLYVWDATLSRVAFNSFNYLDYVIDGTSIVTKFLSNKAKKSNLFYSAVEYLYVLATVNFKAQIKFYDRNNNLMSTQTMPLQVVAPGSPVSYRLNISPSVLSGYFGAAPVVGGDPFTIPFTPPFGGGGVVITAVGYYTVQVMNEAGAPISELRTFILKADECKVKKIEFLFANNLGGIDSIFFTNPRQSINSTKTSVEVAEYGFNQDGNYTNYNQGIYNPTQVSIGHLNVNTFTAVSEPLSDSESQLAASFIESDVKYLVLAGGDLMPVQTDQQEYAIAKRSYSTNNNRITVTFKINDTNFSL